MRDMLGGCKGQPIPMVKFQILQNINFFSLRTLQIPCSGLNHWGYKTSNARA
jgi:hypothetical protein